MQVTINGETREIPDNLSLQELLRHLDLSEERVAVECNRTIVGRERWSQVKVKSGDQLEIVHFVGGGLRASLGSPRPDVKPPVSAPAFSA